MPRRDLRTTVVGVCASITRSPLQQQQHEAKFDTTQQHQGRWPEDGSTPLIESFWVLQLPISIYGFCLSTFPLVYSGKGLAHPPVHLRCLKESDNDDVDY
mmetsp:Transcript_5590/g.8315  ORF Transcript_5590/g.8315 Transcript_5590/m.8315 type:complete len:100 (+) Transcript_5590:424-723(+)